MRIAVADDDPEIGSQVSACLEAAGLSCELFSTGDAIRNALKRETYDVVLLDWNMPGATGLDVLAWATESLEAPPPFIMMTSRGESRDIVRGLEAGACDYIVKPEDQNVILARIQAAARRGAKKAEDRHQEFGPYTIDNLDKTIALNGEAVKLTAKEFALAKMLFENGNRPMARRYLLQEIWGTSGDVETRTLDMHISRVRSKLQLRPQNGFVIQTVFGFGYRMDSYEQESVAVG